MFLEQFSLKLILCPSLMCFTVPVKVSCCNFSKGMATLKFLEQVKLFMGMSHFQVTIRPMLTKLAWIIHLRMHGARLAMYSGSDLHIPAE